MQNSPQWYRDEAYRQSVIRKALLLGFSCEEYEEVYRSYQHNTTRLDVGETITNRRYRFMFEGQRRDAYVSRYSAAYDYLCLLKVPQEVIGDYRG